jgi:hypothetical protein
MSVVALEMDQDLPVPTPSGERPGKKISHEDAGFVPQIVLAARPFSSPGHHIIVEQGGAWINSMSSPFGCAAFPDSRTVWQRGEEVWHENVAATSTNTLNVRSDGDGHQGSELLIAFKIVTDHLE